MEGINKIRRFYRSISGENKSASRILWCIGIVLMLAVETIMPALLAAGKLTDSTGVFVAFAVLQFFMMECVGGAVIYKLERQAVEFIEVDGTQLCSSGKNGLFFLPLKEQDYFWYSVWEWARCYFIFLAAFPALGLLISGIFCGGVYQNGLYGLCLLSGAVAGLVLGLTLIWSQRIKSVKTQKAILIFQRFFGTVIQFIPFLVGFSARLNSEIINRFSSMEVFCSLYTVLLYLGVLGAVFFIAYISAGKNPRAWLL